ncbi:replication initiation protein [Spiroplasma endosymbiont of Nebria brevicollis]|uniref:replication initiation protein n=1 Tax=Spiroplasma endosymbiont of Nebria brevicollis TaxID=3066284 RepID=UPI00313B0E48
MENKNIIKNNKELNIYYSNFLARMNTKFTLEEEKALHLIFKQINAFGKNDTTIKLNKLDFFNKLELESTNRYPRYRKLIRGLIHKTYVEFVDNYGAEYVGVVINSSVWKPREPFFVVELTKMFMPYLELLIRDYTKVDLNSVCAFKSKHSLTLYKFICSWTDDSKQTNQRYITTKDLKELFGLNISDYVYNDKFKRYDFERETIKKAINEINKVSNISLSFKKNKKGNKVLNYEFTWIQKEKTIITKNRKRQLTIFDLDKENTIGKPTKSILSKPNLSTNEIKKILQDFDEH